MNIYFGDIHNHTTLSDGDAAPEPCIAQGKASLDFFAFTDHAQFCDLPYISEANEEYHKGWRDGVPAMMRSWDEIQKLVKANHEPGKFVPFLAYEWSSNRWGDHNVYYLRDDEPLRLARSLRELYASVEGVEAMVIPHHTAYPIHHRGFDWEGFMPSKSPVAEIFSFHGSAETDQGRFGSSGNPMGPRCRAGTLQRGLELGHIFGFIASTDSHHGFPGPYNEGLAAVYAQELTREALWDAFWKRRTYAVSGDRIRLDFRINRSLMGNAIDIPELQPRKIDIEIDAWDCIEMVEIIKNGLVVRRWDHFDSSSTAGAKRHKVGIQWGFHGYPAEKRWTFSVQVVDGLIRGYNTCFKPSGFQEAKLQGSKRLNVSSETRGTAKFGGYFQKVDLDIEGTRDTNVVILTEGKSVLAGTIGELDQENKCAIPFGPYGGAFNLCRAVAEPHFHTKIEWEDSKAESQRDYYYVRAFQKNGQACWSSPIWVARSSTS